MESIEIKFNYGLFVTNHEEEMGLAVTEWPRSYIKEIVKHVKGGDASGLTRNLPAKMLKRLHEAAVENLHSIVDDPDDEYPMYEIVLPAYIPVELLELLPEETQQMLPEDAFRQQRPVMAEEGEFVDQNLTENNVDENVEIDDDDVLPLEDRAAQEAITTKEELFGYIDSKLTDEEKEEIKKSDSTDLHFGFGLWLRNLVIYPKIVNVVKLLHSKEILPLTIHPDIESDELIEAYQEYLRASEDADGEPNMVAPVASETGNREENKEITGKKTAPAKSMFMKCLAVRQPYAQLIVTGIKDIECRDAMPAPKKPKVFIAASGTKIKWGELSRAYQEIYLKYQKKGVLPPYDMLPTKCIIGHVDIVKASFEPVDSVWGAGWDGMKYTLRNAEILDEPIYGKNKATPYFYNVEGYDEEHLPPSKVVKL